MKMAADQSSGKLTIPPARYFPPASGRYEVKPGFFRFGTDFGNGSKDRLLFQFDNEFPHYRASLLSARAERLDKYYGTKNYPEQVAFAVSTFITDQLCDEHPDLFRQVVQSDGSRILHCTMTGETLHLDARMTLQTATGSSSLMPVYASALDALASQIQEDLAVMVKHQSHHRLAAAHLCAPNHWAAEDKLGQDFAALHTPVPGMSTINQRGESLMGGIVAKGPYVRFAWGLATDRRLNHHPTPPPGTDSTNWGGRKFSRRAPELYLRVERQILWPLPDAQAVLFIIRTYFTDCQDIKRDPRQHQALCAAIRSMSSPALHYKGLTGDRDVILAWLCDEAA